MSLNTTKHEPWPQASTESVEVRGAVHDLIRISGCNDQGVEIDMLDRIESGHDKYGTYLTTFNGRDALADAYQEILDAIQYMVQAYMETGNDDYAEFARTLVLHAEVLRTLTIKRDRVKQ